MDYSLLGDGIYRRLGRPVWASDRQVLRMVRRRLVRFTPAGRVSRFRIYRGVLRAHRAMFAGR